MGTIVEGEGDRGLGGRDADGGAEEEGARGESALSPRLDGGNGAPRRGAHHQSIAVFPAQPCLHPRGGDGLRRGLEDEPVAILGRVRDRRDG